MFERPAAGNRAVLVQVDFGQGSIEERLAEVALLASSAGASVVAVVQGRRQAPDPAFYVGKGKADEVGLAAQVNGADLIIFNHDITAAQQRNLERKLNCRVVDRSALILDIFALRAKSHEGKLQVELAQLRYLLPRMIGHGTAMSRLAGGIGGRGPGETKLEIDRRRAKERIHDLERRLLALKQRRDQRRALRRRTGVPVVAIVGYTNAGKSSLLNTVTDSAVIAEDKLFATLDPSVRRIRFPKDYEVVLLDTVGFIRDLPPALVQAFSATLEEVAEADLLLVVVDASDPDQDQQRATVEAILGEIGAGAVPRLWVYNKIDRLDPEELAQRRADADRHTYFISANERRSTAALMQAIDEQLWERGVIERARAAVPEDSSAANDAPAEDP